MKIVAGQVTDLIDLKYSGYQFPLDSTIYVCKKDWESINPVTTNDLLLSEQSFLIKYLPYKDISYADVLQLRIKYGPGIAIESISKICYCKNTSCCLYTCDSTLIGISEEQKVEVFDITALIEEINTNYVKNERRLYEMVKARKK